MFGIEDPGIWLAFLLIFLSVGYSIYYGLRNWNTGHEPDPIEISEDVSWEKVDDKIKEEIL
jgi:hypothetical protein